MRNLKQLVDIIIKQIKTSINYKKESMSMKRLLVLWALLVILVIPAMSQSISLVRSIAIDDMNVDIEVSGSIEIIQWEKKFLRCVTTVTIDSFPNGEWVLGQLAKVGRYNVQYSDGSLRMPNRNKEIWVKGRQFVDTLNIKLYVPYHLTIRIKELLMM